MYLELDFQHLLLTIERLEVRIGERFPSSSLRQVCNEFHGFAARSRPQIRWIVKPNLPIRFSVAAVIVLAFVTAWLSIQSLEFRVAKPKLTEWVQLSEVIINEVLLIGAALFFLFSLENRIKRARTLKALHQLRSLAHVVDMHQLTKDPSMVDQSLAVKSSPKRDLSGFQLKRYLDYCSELLSLIGKLAALYSEKLPDPEVVTAANEIEELCTSLSRKIWQKISTIEDD